MISDAPEDILVGQTLKRPLVTQQLVEDQKFDRQILEHDRLQEFVPNDILYQSSFLSLSHVLSVPSFSGFTWLIV